jgi:GNAT superfamily N-acetyltransferase
VRQLNNWTFIMIPAVIIELNDKVHDSEIEVLRTSLGWDNTTGPFSEIRKGLFAHFTARKDGKLIGFIDILSDGIADAFLQDLMVHPDYQNNGIGSEIMKRAIGFIKSKNIKCIQVTFQDHLLSFYEKFGFYIFKAGIIDRDTMDVQL